VCGVLLAALLYLDMSVASNNGYCHPYQNAPGCYAKYEGALDATREELLGGRAALSADALDTGLPANIGMVVRMDVVDGWRLPLDQTQHVWRGRLTGEPRPEDEAGGPGAGQPLLLNYMAARVCAATPEGSLYAGEWPGEGPRLRKTAEFGGVRVFVNNNALPRAFWRPSWRSADTVAGAIRTLTDPSFDPARECVVEGLRAADAEDPDDGDQPTTAVCSVEAGSPERVVLRVSAPKAGIAVLSDSYARGWKCELDGVPCPILRVNGVFRGVATPAGDHEIVFEYTPPGFVAGACISIGGLLVAALCAGATLLRRS
jgi:hypothetical protein